MTSAPKTQAERLTRPNQAPRCFMDNQETIVVEKVTRAEWIAISALVLTVCGQVFSLGVVYQQVQDHERRMVIEENKSDAMIPRVERIDANVQFLAEQAREARQRRGD
jgi:hypothetical protein